MNNRSYVKLWRDEAVFEIIAANPLAWALATVIALRARWSQAFNVHGLMPGEAFLGDFKRCGMTEQQYRTAKAQLEKWRFASFRPTNKGTVAKLTDTRLFSILPDSDNGQGNGRPTDGQRTANGRVTTNVERIEGIQGIEGDTGSAPAGLPVELPAGFPATEQAAKAACGTVGCPDELILKVWNRAMSRGGRDSKDVLIRNFAHHVATAWSYERDYQSRNPQHSQPGKQKPHKPTLQDFF